MTSTRVSLSLYSPLSIYLYSPPSVSLVLHSLYPSLPSIQLNRTSMVGRMVRDQRNHFSRSTWPLQLTNDHPQIRGSSILRKLLMTGIFLSLWMLFRGVGDRGDQSSSNSNSDLGPSCTLRLHRERSLRCCGHQIGRMKALRTR